jgi:phosphotransferase system enzyme I (PtsI)
MDRMATAGDEYIRERAYDIQDIAQKISDHLLYGESDDVGKFIVTEDTIFLNDMWSVSDFVYIDTQHVKGIISPSGGASSHISVLADSLGFPAVLGLGTGTQNIQEGDFLIIDGGIGTVIVNPTPETIALYKQQIEALDRLNKTYLKSKNSKVKPLRDGKEDIIPIAANIEMAGHVTNALKSGADEIGLFRTEFPFLVRKSLPTEDEQYQLYRYVLRMMKRKPVTFRTLDIGGDKYLSYLDLPKETNPSLGWRSIRFSLERKDLFRIQLRALIKASIFGRMRLLFPMVSHMEQPRRSEGGCAGAASSLPV